MVLSVEDKTFQDFKLTHEDLSQVLNYNPINPYSFEPLKTLYVKVSEHANQRFDERESGFKLDTNIVCGLYRVLNGHQNFYLTLPKREGAFILVDSFQDLEFRQLISLKDKLESQEKISKSGIHAFTAVTYIDNQDFVREANAFSSVNSFLWSFDSLMTLLRLSV